MGLSGIPFFSRYHFPGYKQLLTVPAPHNAASISLIQLPDNHAQDITLIEASSCPNPILLFDEEIPLFAGDKVAFPGQPAALLLGSDKDRLEECAKELLISYQAKDHSTEEDIVYCREIKNGNIEDLKAGAFQTIEGTFQIHGQARTLLHPFGVAARWHPKKNLMEVSVPTQWPGHVRESIVKALGISENAVIIHPLDFSVHGPLLEWIPSIFAVYAAVAARVSGEKVLMEISPSRLGRWINASGSSTILIATGLDKEGNILFLDLSFRYDAGGITSHAHRIIDREIYNAGGRYNFSSFRIKGEAFRSSWPGPREPRMGYSLSPVTFALECHLNRLAEISQQDPSELKQSLLLKEGDMDIAGVTCDSGMPLATLLEQVCELSDFKRKHSANELLKKRRVSLDRELEPLKGTGLSLSMNGNGLFGDREHINRWKIRVTLTADNTVAIETSGFLGSSGSGSLCRKRAARVLGLSPEAVYLLQDPSPVDFDSGPSSHGRNASVILDLVEKACLLIQKKRFRDPLPISVVKATAPPRKNRWNEEKFLGNPFPRLSYGACVVETELDPVDFLIKVRNIWMIIDAGSITDTKLAETSLRGGIYDTLISCYGQRIHKHLPSISIRFYKESRLPLSSSIHELPSLLLPAALISSISQASGSYFDSLPLSTSIIERYTGEP